MFWKAKLLNKLVTSVAFSFLSLLVFGQAEDEVVRSEVTLVRLDVQVVDGANRAIPDLRAADFVLREQGKVRQIKNFAQEEMPLDLLLLIDVSGSMRVHVEQLANAAHDAFQVLGRDDRVAIAVFDDFTRVRLSLQSSANAERELRRVLQTESFNRGTDIAQALLMSAENLRREGRPVSRRAIVILTDDVAGRAVGQREFDALTRADVVLSALLVPESTRISTGGGWGGRQRRVGFPGGGWPGGGWPGGGWPGGGGVGFPGGGVMTKAGTGALATQTGGDVFRSEDSNALIDTLERLRQRYALYFSIPTGTRPGEQRNVDVQLSEAAKRRFSNTTLRFRQTYWVPADFDPASASDDVVTEVSAVTPESTEVPKSTRGRRTTEASPTATRRPAMTGDSGPRGPNRSVGAAAPESLPAKTSPLVDSVGSPDPQDSRPRGWAKEQPTNPGGWRRIGDPEPLAQPK
jgi:VWFA-related protein